MAIELKRIQLLTKPGSEWTAADPVMLIGEIGVANVGSSTPVLKIGDGVRPWSQLPDLTSSGSGGGGANDYIAGPTVTLPPGTPATVTIDNTVDPPTISFGIPQGIAGPPGDPGTPGTPGTPGAPGDPGPPNTLTIGTVTTGAPGSAAGATITGASPNQILSLTIPQGAQGAPGTPGPPGNAMLADPSATIGLTVKVGTSIYALRSDAAQALDQSISPTWTGRHVFGAVAGFTLPAIANRVYMGGNTTAPPMLTMINTSGAANAKRWDQYAAAGALVSRVVDDEDGATSIWRQVNRTGTTITSIALSALAVDLTGGILNLSARGALADLADGYLRINNGGSYAQGIYTPGVLRASNDVRSDTAFTNVDGSRSLSWNMGAATMASVTLKGARNNWVGLVIDDGDQLATFMSSGVTGGVGVYLQGKSRWSWSDDSGGFTIVRAVTAPSFNATSSRTIKRKTGTPSHAANILARLRPILYRLLADPKHEQVGLIAEDVHDICPWLSRDGKTVSYDRLALLLLADWQESRGITPHLENAT